MQPGRAKIITEVLLRSRVTRIALQFPSFSTFFFQQILVN